MDQVSLPPKGVWVRWMHQVPPLGVEVEGSWTASPDAETNMTRGGACKRGCCFVAFGENLVPPMWWRIPDSASEPLEQK